MMRRLTLAGVYTFLTWLAACRLIRLERRIEFGDLPQRLRQVRRFPHRALCDPSRWDGTILRFLRFLPPYHLGPCLKRSLLLLDLWSRCGLEPTLHLGVTKVDNRPRSHAWVTASGYPVEDPSPYREIWSA